MVLTVTGVVHLMDGMDKQGHFMFLINLQWVDAEIERGYRC